MTIESQIWEDAYIGKIDPLKTTKDYVKHHYEWEDSEFSKKQLKKHNDFYNATHFILPATEDELKLSKSAQRNISDDLKNNLSNAKLYSNTNSEDEYLITSNSNNRDFPYDINKISRSKSGLINKLEGKSYFNDNDITDDIKTAFAKTLVYPDASKDEARAKELASTVRKGVENWDNDPESLVSIKHKQSNSQWYENAGELNSRSQYDYTVPKTVLNEAKELNSIRKKYQGSPYWIFDFETTKGWYVVESNKDHSSYGHGAGVEYEKQLD